MFYKVKINFLLLLICSYLSGGLFSFESHASTVNTIKNKEIFLKLDQLEQSNKNKTSVEETIVINPLFYSPRFIQISNFTQTPKNNIATKKNRSSHKTPSNQNTQNTDLFPNLYSETKQFIKDNNDNVLLQDTLFAFSQTRQFLTETDLMLHNLTQDIIAYLDIDTSMSNNNRNYKSTSNNFKQYYDIENLKQQNNKEKWAYSDTAIFSLIFNLQNLYYLIAFIFFIGMVKQIIKFMLLKDQHNSHNRR